MKQKQKKKISMKEIMHQHRGEDARIFGKKHPLTSIHIKESTQKAHRRTLILDELDSKKARGF